MSHWRKYDVDEEMLIVHRPAGPQPSPGAAGEPLPAGFERLERLLARATDPAQRRRIVAAMQARLGNAAAARVVASVEARKDGPDEDGERPAKEREP